MICPSHSCCPLDATAMWQPWCLTRAPTDSTAPSWQSHQLDLQRSCKAIVEGPETSLPWAVVLSSCVFLFVCFFVLSLWINSLCLQVLGPPLPLFTGKKLRGLSVLRSAEYILWVAARPDVPSCLPDPWGFLQGHRGTLLQTVLWEDSEVLWAGRKEVPEVSRNVMLLLYHLWDCNRCMHFKLTWKHV